MFEGLFQPVHLLIILFIVLLIFGPGKLGNLGGELGRGIREFKKAISDNKDSATEARQIPTSETSKEKVEK